MNDLRQTRTDGAYLDWASVTGALFASRSLRPIVSPEFQAGDALLFDEMFLHRKALDPSMTEERYAIKSWFFAPSRYPADATPIDF